MDKKQIQKSIQLIELGKIIVLPTDTLYGIHVSALNKLAVDRVYEIKKRSLSRPFIILIGSLDQLKLFKVKPEKDQIEFLKKYWPGKVSVILPVLSNKYKYLHRGKNSLAFRLPNRTDLRQIMLKTGPLISTTVNHQGEQPALNIKQAKANFGNKIEYYLDDGELESPSSTLVDLSHKTAKVLREGEVIIHNE